MLHRVPGWLSVPDEVGHRVPDVPGATPREVHCTHLPLLPPDVRAIIEDVNEGATGPGGAAHRQEGLLRPYQQTAADFTHDRFGSILGLDCGLGKTRTALAATYAPDKIGIIVAPLVAWSVWRREIALVYGPDYPVTEVYGRRLSDDEDLCTPGIYIVNPEIVQQRYSEWMTVRPAFTILDEAHLYINRRTKRHEGARGLASISDHRVALTGTPILRHLVDLHGMLQCVVSGAFGSWYEFAMWLGGTRGKHGGVQLGVVPRAVQDRLEVWLSEVMIRMQWEDVTDSVPPLTRERLPVVLSDRDAKHYNRLMQDVREVLGDRVTYDGLLQASKLIQVGALRRFIGRVKIPAIVDLVCSTTEPVVVWTWHRDVAEDIVRRVNHDHEGGPAAVTVTGEEPRGVRDERIDRFQRGAGRVIVCTMGAAGLGVDLTRARLTVFAEQSWTPAEMSQCERRVFRTRQTQACVTYWPLVAGTIEERILDVLQEKEDHAKSGLLDGVTSPVTTKAAGLDSIVNLVDLVVGEVERRSEVRR